MSKPKKLLKKMIIAVFSESNNRSYSASVGIFFDSLTEEPAITFSLADSREEELEKIIAKKLEELSTDDYRWEVVFSKEIKTLTLESKILFFLDPEPYINMNELQFNYLSGK